MAIPTMDSQLITFGQNMDTRATASPGTFGLASSQATVLHGYFADYQTAYNAERAARAAGIRDKSLTTATRAAKQPFLDYARQIYAFIQASSSVTDANKNLIGVTVRKTTNTRRPVPDMAPVLRAVRSVANTIELLISDPDSPTRRGMPPGVLGVNIFSYVGATAPVGNTGWKFEGGTGRKTAIVSFDPAIAPGTKVWFTGFFFNQRKQSGPAADPISANILGGGATPMAA